MRKATPNQKKERRVWRWLIGTSLAVTLVAFGCSTNDNTISGEPARSTPMYTPSGTPGSSSGTEGIPPMASSFTYSNAPAMSSTDALATLAADQGYQGRLLGPVGPVGPQTETVTAPTGQVVNPAMIANPQPTVNPSFTSPGYPAITGGDTGSGAALFTAPLSVGTAAPLTTMGTTGVGALPPTGAIVPGTTAFSSTVTGQTTFTPGVSNSVVTGTTPGAPGNTIGTAATAPLAATTLGVGAAPPTGAVVPSGTGSSPTLSGSVLFTPMASSSTVTGTTRTAGTPAITNTTATRTQSVRIVAQPNGQLLITNAKQ